MKNYEIEINGETYRVAVKELAADADMATTKPTPSQEPTPEPAVAAPSAAPAASTGTEVKAPMPGTILSVKVAVGQTVAQGDVLAILEAMKMENEIIAPVAGVVGEILINANDSVQSDQLLFKL